MFVLEYLIIVSANFETEKSILPHGLMWMPLALYSQDEETPLILKP